MYDNNDITFRLPCYFFISVSLIKPRFKTPLIFPLKTPLFSQFLLMYIPIWLWGYFLVEQAFLNVVFLTSGCFLYRRTNESLFSIDMLLTDKTSDATKKVAENNQYHSLQPFTLQQISFNFQTRYDTSAQQKKQLHADYSPLPQQLL